MPNLADEILEFAKQQSLLNLLESGVDVNFIQPILERLNSAVANGENLDLLLDELEVLMVSTEATTSLLQRYISQVASDSITQFNATYTQILVQGTNIEFYYYDGTAIAKTRAFCKNHQQKYFHFKEVQLLGDGKEIDGSKLSPDELRGRISGTNQSSIFINRGGWHCRHQFAPVSINSVPNEVLQRAIAKNYYAIKKKTTINK